MTSQSEGAKKSCAEAESDTDMLDAAFAVTRQVRLEALKDALAVAKKHEPKMFKRNALTSDEIYISILDEQRGERLAAEIIGRKIQDLIDQVNGVSK